MVKSEALKSVESPVPNILPTSLVNLHQQGSRVIESSTSSLAKNCGKNRLELVGFRLDRLLGSS